MNGQIVPRKVGGKRRIFNFLEVWAEKGFSKPLKTELFPLSLSPRLSKLPPDLVRDQGVDHLGLRRFEGKREGNYATKAPRRLPLGLAGCQPTSRQARSQ